MPRKSHESGGESPVPLPRAQDNVPSLTPRRSARRAAASESETEAPRVTRTKAKAEAEPELDVDALPASLTANGNEQKAAPKVTGNIPHDFKGLPPFTLKQLRDAIPAHCFQRSFWRSFSYVIADGIALAAMYYGMFWLTQQREWLALPYAARVAGWAVWGWVTGVFGTGWWVLAHECGHHAFSASAMANNVVGYVLHTLLLVPYYSWQITHAKHHHHTGHMTKDQVFVPGTRSEIGLPKPAEGVEVLSEREAMKRALEDDEPTAELQTIPILHLFRIIVMWTLGWPGYLLFNVASQKHEGWQSHFFPNSAIFDGVKNAKTKVVKSDIGIIAMLGALGYAINVFGFEPVWRWYFMPWLWVNFWLVTITFLQHTHPSIPHYRAPIWNFTLGALATIDRSYGFLDVFFHHITDTHVAHHLFSTMPHYHAIEATKKLKEVMGEWYLYSDEGVLSSVYNCWSDCRFVEDEGDVLFFKK